MLRSATEATVRIGTFGDEELVAASGYDPVHALDSAMRKENYPQLVEVYLEEFDVRFLHVAATLRRAAPVPWSESWRFFRRWLTTASSGNCAASVNTDTKFHNDFFSRGIHA